MVQTGDPKGDGTGGESIWGGTFEDEIKPQLRHDRPFTVAMANGGPNTNGSQCVWCFFFCLVGGAVYWTDDVVLCACVCVRFYITTAATPWLDGKHTVFGRVTNGAATVTTIENVKTGHQDKPFQDVKILSVDIK